MHLDDFKKSFFNIKRIRDKDCFKIQFNRIIFSSNDLLVRNSIKLQVVLQKLKVLFI